MLSTNCPLLDYNLVKYDTLDSFIHKTVSCKAGKWQVNSKINLYINANIWLLKIYKKYKNASLKLRK